MGLTPLTVLGILSTGMVGCDYMALELDRTFSQVFFVFVVVAADIVVIVVVVEVDNVVVVKVADSVFVFVIIVDVEHEL